jgi:serine/threonine-protein kinase
MKKIDIDVATWSALNKLLDTALDLPPSERGAWLDRLGAEFDELKPRLRDLLAHEASVETGDFLRTLPKVDAIAVSTQAPSKEQHGTQVGPYRLLSELGSGGMGSVWLAERADGMMNRRVALKLPHVAGRLAGLEERMAREREILATLNHPNIATLYEAGVTTDGQPYLALEYVEGKPIDDYCKEHSLDLRARLKLFAQVANAVAHAHAKLVVHRDLKPSNILVTADGQVRLLDFGIAKLLEDGSARRTQLTELTGRALTPDYASPEQILGQPISTASDVYSLGVILYQLLAGERPYKLRRDSRGALEDAIVQADPARPSAVSQQSFRKSLRGDLDNIVLKALKKKPEERYAAVLSFVGDVYRFLDHKPVSARPDSRWYRLSRAVIRHKFGVASASIIFGLIVTGALVSLWQAREAREGQRRAEDVKSFLTDLLVDVDPYNTTAKSWSSTDLLQRALERLHELPADRIELRIELADIVGNSLIGTEQFEEADAVFLQAIDEATQRLGRAHPLTLRVRVARTTVMRFRGLHAELREELPPLVALLRTAGGELDKELYGAITNSAHLAIDDGQYAEAGALAREARSIAGRAFGDRHVEHAKAALVVAVADSYAGDPRRALESSASANELVLAAIGGDRPHALVLDARFVYGRALGNVGRYEDAVSQLHQARQDANSLLGADAQIIGFLSADMARFQLELGRASESLIDAENALRIVGGVAGDKSYTVAMARVHVGRALHAVARYEDAKSMFELARESMRAARGDSSPLVADIDAMHALTIASLGRVAEARASIERNLSSYRSAEPLFKYRGLYFAGAINRLAGNAQLADDLLRESHAALPDEPVHRFRRGNALLERAGLAVERGSYRDAVELVEALPWRATDEHRATSPEGAERSLVYGRALLGLQRNAEALREIKRSHAYWLQTAPDSRRAAIASTWLGVALAAAGRRLEAREYLRLGIRFLSTSSLPLDQDVLLEARRMAAQAG